MSYTSISKCVRDDDFTERVYACIAQEQVTRNETVNPGAFSSELTWATASANDVEAAYESALAADNPNPGSDLSVISDAMILSHVQANWPTK